MRGLKSTRGVIVLAFLFLIGGIALTVWDVQPTVTILATLLVGAAVNFLVAQLYYVAAGNELSAEAQRLAELTTMTLEALEEEGLATLRRDERGRIIGIVRLKLRGEARGQATVTATLMGGEPGDPPR
ncbi:MAG: hypothetical protein M3R02_30630 [Chloroflexota bacterium]|nr:hypothetical protein [Chloroflexota bacterium]